jgi:polar amino acid transport system substrate-binding protein
MSKRWNSSLASALVLTAVVAFSFGFVARAQAQSEPVCAALVITGHPSYPPIAWAAQGKIVGAAPTLVSGIATRLGVKNVVSKDFGSWEGAQEAVRGGQADVIFGIYKNDARAVYLDYIEPPFMMDPVSIVVRKGAGFIFAEWSDLKGRKGVTNNGESYGDKFDAFMAKELTVTRSAGVDKAFETLLAQQVDYMIIGLFPGRNEARKLGLIDRIEFLSEELVSAAMYVAFSKQSKCGALRTGFSAGIKTAVDADTMRQLLAATDQSLGQ